MKVAEMLDKEGISCEVCPTNYHGYLRMLLTWCKILRLCINLMQVINLRTLKPIDRDSIAASIRKTHRVISVEEGWPQCGVGSEIISIAIEDCFDDLDAPPERVTGVEVPMPYASHLESAALPQVDDIVRVVKRVMS